MKKKVLFIGLICFFILSSQAFALSFTMIQAISDNRDDTGWIIRTVLMLEDAVSPTAEYSIDGSNYYPLSPFVWGHWQGFDTNVCDDLGCGQRRYEGKTFYYRVYDSGTTLEASGKIPKGALKKLKFSRKIEIFGNPEKPTVSWVNVDSEVTEYRLRVLDPNNNNNLIWESGPPLYDNIFNFETMAGQNGHDPFAFSQGIPYVVRVEAKGHRILYQEYSGPQPDWGLPDVLNRSVVHVPYSY